ncbi:hypothetical protein OIO90_001497 [Microbotryomycetes sp. JL221]|nr:hypothetical protein OIO90_001497 [Microbotryomycetes sp. JL221]
MATEPGGASSDDWSFDYDVGSTLVTTDATDHRTWWIGVGVVVAAGALALQLYRNNLLSTTTHGSTASSSSVASKQDKKRVDNLVKKIKQQQLQRQMSSTNLSAATSTNTGGPTVDDDDGDDTTLASTSVTSTLVNKLSSLWSGNAHASTSRVRLDTIDAASSDVNTSPSTSRRSSMTPDVFSTAVNSRRQSLSTPDSALHSTKKGRSRGGNSAKGKQSASATSRTTSPTRGRTHKPHVNMSDAAVQASFPINDTLDNASRAGSPEHSRSDLVEDAPPLLPPPSPAPKLQLLDALVQTSPGFENHDSRRSSLASPFDLHKSFQSTPDALSSMTLSDTRNGQDSRSVHLTSASMSPTNSTSSRKDKSPSSSVKARQSASSSPTLHSNELDPTSSTSRSRKQARKASQSRSSGVHDKSPARVVVGLHRLVRDRDPTDDSEANSSSHTGALSPAFGSTEMSRSASASSQQSTGSNGGSRRASLAQSAKHEAAAARRPSFVNSTVLLQESPSPLAHAQSNGIRRSSTPGGNSSGRSDASSLASPHHGNNKLLMTSSTMSSGGGVVRRGSWSGVMEQGSNEVGLAIDLSESASSGDRASSGGGSRKESSVESGAAVIRTGSRSWSSNDGNSPPSAPSMVDGYFPALSQTALTTPDSSPHPTNRKLLAMSTASAHKQWQAMSPVYPIRSSNMASQQNSGNVLVRQQPQASAQGQPSPHAPAESSSRVPSRQPSLTLLMPSGAIPPPPPPPPSVTSTGLTASQQQTYAQMYAQAQAQYQHMIALQYQAQQIHQRQQQVAAARQRLELEQQQQHNAMRQHSQHPPLTPNGLVYPISSANTPQTPMSMPPQATLANQWSAGSHQLSPAQAHPHQSVYRSLSQTASPTVYAFAPNVQQPPFINGQNMTNASAAAYYAAAMNGYPPPSPSRPPALTQRSSTTLTPGSNGKKMFDLGSPGVGLAASPISSSTKKNVVRPAHLRTRSASATTTLSSLATVAAATPTQDEPLSSPVTTARKHKEKGHEFDPDRVTKELEIARWRVSVLEEEQRLNDLENQEALRALAARAMRAEARIKMLEAGASNADVSASSSSGDLSVHFAGMSTSTEEWVPDSPSGAKIHPLSWLDLDQVSFSTRPQSSPSAAKPPPFLTSSHRRRSTRGSRRSRRKSSQTSLSQHQPPTMTPLNAAGDEDDDDEEVLIVLDAPHARRASGSSSAQELSRSPSFGTIVDEYHSSEQASPLHQSLDDSFVNSNSEQDDTGEEFDDEPNYIGSLPTFLQAVTGRSSRSPSLSGSSPRQNGLRRGSEQSSLDEGHSMNEDVSVFQRRGMPELTLDTSSSTIIDHEDDDFDQLHYPLVNELVYAGLPKFQLDCATPDALSTQGSSPLETIEASPSSSSGESTTPADNTPKPPAAPSPTDSDSGNSVDASEVSNAEATFE